MIKKTAAVSAKRIAELKTQFPKQDFGITERQSRMLALIACSDGLEISKDGISRVMPGTAADREAATTKRAVRRYPSI